MRKLFVASLGFTLTSLMLSCGISFNNNRNIEQEAEQETEQALTFDEYQKTEGAEDDFSESEFADTLEFSQLDQDFYEDNSLADSIWSRDEALLTKDLDNDSYIENINHAWLHKVGKSIFGKEYNEDEKIDVIIESDSIIKMRLAVLNSKTPIDLDYNPIVQSFIETYVYKRAGQMSRMMGLAEYYYPLFEQVLDKYNIPLELKHLAIVESALNPRAKSRVGASGLWQFMYATGKVYGLKVSSYVDERFDPIKSTEAAARMMSDLYSMFGDWNLVLAAYNSGPGNVKKAIRRSGGSRNFWYIRPYLPRETRNYVPAFIAVNYAMNHSLDHNIKPAKPLFSFFETDTVVVRSTINFDQIQREINIDKAELEFLNPSYKLEIIPKIEDKNYKLILPLAFMDQFVSNEDSIYSRVSKEYLAEKVVMPKYYEANDKITYKVRSGDNLGAIARKYGVKSSEIKKWNGLRNNNIFIGQRLTIYPKNFAQAQNNESGNSKSQSKDSKQSGSGYSYYTVKKGDSLWSIAKKYPGVSADNIKSWNKIKNGKSLKVGMKLKIAI